MAKSILRLRWVDESGSEYRRESMTCRELICLLSKYEMDSKFLMANYEYPLSHIKYAEIKRHQKNHQTVRVKLPDRPKDNRVGCNIVVWAEELE